MTTQFNGLDSISGRALHAFPVPRPGQLARKISVAQKAMVAVQPREPAPTQPANSGKAGRCRRQSTLPATRS